MIHFLIKRARKRMHESYTTRYVSWQVLHPSNDSILAMCDTEEEADRVICLLDAFCEADAFGLNAPKLVKDHP